VIILNLVVENRALVIVISLGIWFWW